MEYIHQQPGQVPQSSKIEKVYYQPALEKQSPDIFNAEAPAVEHTAHNGIHIQTITGQSTLFMPENLFRQARSEIQSQQNSEQLVISEVRPSVLIIVVPNPECGLDGAHTDGQQVRQNLFQLQNPGFNVETICRTVEILLPETLADDEQRRLTNFIQHYGQFDYIKLERSNNMITLRNLTWGQYLNLFGEVLTHPDLRLTEFTDDVALMVNNTAQRRRASLLVPEL